MDNFSSKDLFDAIVSSSLETTQKIIDSGIDVNVRNSIEGATPLHYAASKSYIVWTKLLLDAGADVTIKDTCGYTPLHWAANNHKLGAVELLLNAGADVNSKNSHGYTPLHLALHSVSMNDPLCNDSLRIAKILIELGADVNAKNDIGETPIYNTVQLYSLNVTEFLIESGANVNVSNEYGWTLLHKILFNLYDEFIEDFDEDDEKYTVNTYLNLAEILIDNDIDINAQNIDGCTALHKAVQYELPVMVQFLLSVGIDDAIKNKDGKTAYDLMEKEGIKFWINEIAYSGYTFENKSLI